jgi:copper(I)-binding protein
LKPRIPFAFLAILAGLFASVAAAQEFRFSGLVITEPWAPATIAPGQAGAVYLTLTNEAEEGEYLVGASTEIAAMAHLHETQVTNGVARMVPIERLSLEPGMNADLSPGGIHIMLMGLTAPLTIGQSFRMTLTFEQAGPIKIDVQVRALGG